MREDSPDNDIDERELVNESDEDLQAYQSGSELMDDVDFEAMLVAIEERKWARQKRREIAAQRRVEALEAEYGWKFPKSEAKTSDIDNLAFLACITQLPTSAWASLPI